MEIMTSQAVHVRALTSPESPRTRSMHFYSAPTSPIQRALDASYGYESDYAGTVLQAEQEPDDFEFETSKKFGVEGLDQFETSPGSDHPLDDHHREQKQKQRQRGGSMPTMAFADELFSDGLVLPLALKLPPRLQHCAINGSATPSPPRSPAPTKFSFPRRWRSAWNDEFDPFAVALEKVRGEEERRGKNHHRRARSLSPFRTAQEGSGKPVISTEFPGETAVKKGENTDQVATRKHKVKEFLHRYASFGREKKKKKKNNNEVKLKEQIAALWKGSYLQKKLSFNDSKENSQSKTNKKACGEPKNTEDVAQYHPRLALCLSFHVESP